MKTILTVIGARPQFIKHAPFQQAIKNNFNEITVHTGQHYDDNMSHIFFNEMHIKKPDYNLNIGSGTHAVQTGKMMIALEKLFIDLKPDLVLIYGDTNSTLAGALVASKLKIKIAHIEAGMRSFNMKMPEEINRLISDRLSNYNFASTFTALDNLKKEGLEGYYTGDIMYDAFLFYSEKSKNIENRLSDYILLTIHREYNTIKENFIKIMNNILKSNYHYIFPVHPRTQKLIDEYFSPNHHILNNIMLLKPQGYIEMLSLINNSKAVMTDSGGLQKEAYFANKQCITLRNETEWRETLNNDANVLCPYGECDIDDILDNKNIKFENYFGNGDAAIKIINYLLEYL